MLPFVDKTILVRLRTLCFSDIIEKKYGKNDSEKCFLFERQEGEEKNCMKNTVLLIAEQYRSTMKVPEKQNSYFMNMHWGVAVTYGNEKYLLNRKLNRSDQFEKV